MLSHPRDVPEFRMVARIFVVAFLLLAFLKSPSAGQTDTFRQFTRETIDSLITVFLQDTPWLSEESVFFASPDDDKEINLLLRDRYLNRPGFHGSQVSGNLEEATGYRVDSDVMKLSLSFDFPESTDEIRAVADAAVFFRITDQRDGNILKEKRYHLRNVKTYPMSIVTEENAHIPNASPEEKTSKGTRIVEPILLSGVTGIVVYLFYALRSR